MEEFGSGRFELYAHLDLGRTNELFVCDRPFIGSFRKCSIPTVVFSASGAWMARARGGSAGRGDAKSAVQNMDEIHVTFSIFLPR